MEELQFSTERSRPGWVLERKVGPGLFEKVVDWSSRALARHLPDELLHQVEGTLFENLISIYSTPDASPGVESLEDELETPQQTRQFENRVSEQKNVWRQGFQRQLDSREFAEIQKTIETICEAEYRSRSALQEGLERLEGEKAKLRRKRREISDFAAEFQSDYVGISEQLSDLRKLTAEERRRLEERLSLPKIDLVDFSGGLFRRIITQRFGWIDSAFDTLRRYIPEKTEAELTDQKSPPPIERSRSVGTDYNFQTGDAYPAFWVKEGRASIKTVRGGGRLRLVDISSFPPAVDGPVTIVFTGDLPERGINELWVQLLSDRSKSFPYDRFDFVVNDYSVEKWPFVSSEELTFGLLEASGELSFRAELENRETRAQLSLQLVEPDFRVESTSERLESVLRAAVEPLDLLTVEATGVDRGEGLRWTVSSNLGSSVMPVIREQLRAEFERAQVELQKIFDKQLQPRIDRAEAELVRLREHYEQQLSELEGRVESLLEEASVELEGRLKDKVDESLEPGLERLRERFSF